MPRQRMKPQINLARCVGAMRQGLLEMMQHPSCPSTAVLLDDALEEFEQSVYISDRPSWPFEVLVPFNETDFRGY